MRQWLRIFDPFNIIDGEAEEWRKVFEVNVMAVCICTREAVRIMKDNGIAGQIIHMNSLSILPKTALNVYPASKAAVMTMADSLRDELHPLGTGIKVTVSLYLTCNCGWLSILCFILDNKPRTSDERIQ